MTHTPTLEHAILLPIAATVMGDIITEGVNSLIARMNIGSEKNRPSYVDSVELTYPTSAIQCPTDTVHIARFDACIARMF
jgi:hypothetical protein